VNPHIDVAGWNLKPVTEALALGNERLVVGVSAFGFGGTNAHAVLTSYEEEDTGRATARPAAESHAAESAAAAVGAQPASATRYGTRHGAASVATAKTFPTTTLPTAPRITAT
jgi:phthiocerol/phenolphthiocerol synthesis type-I polyketide synthase D